MEETNKPQVPPYISYRTFRNFVDGLKPVPPVIDRSIMTTMSGIYQSQLLSALKYMNLIDEDGATQKDLRRLAQSGLEERSQILREILENAYTFLFEPKDGFDIETGTSKQFELAFQSQGASGDTVRRCAKFFLDAAKDADIPVSQYIKTPTSTIRKSTSKKPKDQKGDDKSQTKEGYKGETPPPPPADNKLSGYSEKTIKWLEELNRIIERLPDTKNGSWTKEERERWLNALHSVLDMIIKIED